jgi:hypothetical protein
MRQLKVLFYNSQLSWQPWRRDVPPENHEPYHLDAAAGIGRLLAGDAL